MALGLIGRKLKMTRIFNEKGKDESVTIIKAGPCRVVAVKDGKDSKTQILQLGYQEVKEDMLNKPRAGYFKKLGLAPVNVLKEFKIGNVHTTAHALKAGDLVGVDIFSEGEKINIQAISKGKGFAGVVKRWKFSGGPKTHGQSDRLRAPGSVGQSSFPSHVFKGLRMGGRMGNAWVTVKNLMVLKIYKEDNTLLVRGAVPGTRENFIIINKQS